MTALVISLMVPAQHFKLEYYIFHLAQNIPPPMQQMTWSSRANLDRAHIGWVSVVYRIIRSVRYIAASKPSTGTNKLNANMLINSSHPILYTDMLSAHYRCSFISMQRAIKWTLSTVWVKYMVVIIYNRVWF